MFRFWLSCHWAVLIRRACSFLVQAPGWCQVILIKCILSLHVQVLIKMISGNPLQIDLALTWLSPDRASGMPERNLKFLLGKFSHNNVLIMWRTKDIIDKVQKKFFSYGISKVYFVRIFLIFLDISTKIVLCAMILSYDD